MSPRLVDLLSLFVGLAAAAGLTAMIIQLPPSPLYEAAALLFILLAVAGLTAPLWRRLLRKLMGGKAGEGEITVMGVRFGMWTGLFVASLVLLRVLAFTDRVLILAILVLLIMVEMFLQQRAASKRGARRSRR